MNRLFIYGLISGMVLSSGIWALLFQFQLHTTTQTSSKWTGESMEIKFNAARKAGSPKILILSGSSGHFSISAYQLQSETSVPTVNLSLHAGLGLPYILDKAKRFVNASDIIILIPEYGNYIYSESVSSLFLDHIAAHDVEYFSDMTAKQKVSAVFSFSVGRLMKGVLTKLGVGFPPPTIGYDAETISSLGDELSNTGSRFIGPPKDIQTGKIEIGNTVAGKMSEFAKWSTAQGAVVFAGFPPYPETKLPHNLGANIDAFWALSSTPVLGTPEMYLYPESFFFDTSYHMNDYGRRVHTQKLLKDLNEQPQFVALIARTNEITQ